MPGARPSPDIAGVTRFTVAQSRGGPPGRDIEVRLQGERVAALKTAAADVVALLSGCQRHHRTR
jgi:hypothetical protein